MQHAPQQVVEVGVFVQELPGLFEEVFHRHGEELLPIGPGVLAEEHLLPTVDAGHHLIGTLQPAGLELRVQEALLAVGDQVLEPEGVRQFMQRHVVRIAGVRVAVQEVPPADAHETLAGLHLALVPAVIAVRPVGVRIHLEPFEMAQLDLRPSEQQLRGRSGDHHPHLLLQLHAHPLPAFLVQEGGGDALEALFPGGRQTTIVRHILHQKGTFPGSEPPHPQATALPQPSDGQRSGEHHAHDHQESHLVHVVRRVTCLMARARSRSPSGCGPSARPSSGPFPPASPSP